MDQNYVDRNRRPRVVSLKMAKASVLRARTTPHNMALHITPEMWSSTFRVMHQVLTPSVEHCQKANAGSKMSGISGNL